MIHTNGRPFLYVPTLVLLMLSHLGVHCSETPEPWEPVIGPFDPGPDDAGPGALCPAGAADLFNNTHSPYFGGEDSVELEVVNVANFACPHCARFAEETREMWSRRPEFKSKVRFYFHHRPWDERVNWEVHGATIAAHNQSMGSFWAMHDFVFDGIVSASKYYEQSDLLTYAHDSLGLDMTRFEIDMESPETYGFLNWETEHLRSLGINATPTVYICGKEVERSLLEVTIDAYLLGQ